MYRIELKHLPYECPGLFNWCLDLPSDRSAASLLELTQEGIWFQGWILTRDAEPVRGYLKQNNEYAFFDLNTLRSDVVKTVLHAEPEGHPQHRCGFRQRMTIEHADFTFGVELDGRYIDLISAQIVGTFKVLQGKDGWLFLDNDTNQSVEQFTGKLRLDRPAVAAWDDYLTSSIRVAEQHDIPFALLIAPTKESVYSDKYPYDRAPITAIDEVLNRAGEDYPLVYPTEALRRAPMRSFRITDTHWSVYGACVATKELGQQLDIQRVKLDALYANDSYRLQTLVGDLGNKLFPNQAAEELLLTSFNFRRFIHYDNGLQNFGRILMCVNPAALVDGHCLVFGSSSIYSMLNYLTRLFSTITVIHSAGNIDPAILAAIKPQYLVAQTNARFVIRAPVTHYDLPSVISGKLDEMCETEQTELLHQSHQWTSKHDSELGRYYHQLLAGEH